MSSLRRWGRDDLEFSGDMQEYHCPQCKSSYGLRLIFGHYEPGEDRFSVVYVRCHKMFCDDCAWSGKIADLLVKNPDYPWEEPYSADPEYEARLELAGRTLETFWFYCEQRAKLIGWSALRKEVFGLHHKDGFRDLWVKLAELEHGGAEYANQA